MKYSNLHDIPVDKTYLGVPNGKFINYRFNNTVLLWFNKMIY
jgi:hypothetical protein